MATAKELFGLAPNSAVDFARLMMTYEISVRAFDMIPSTRRDRSIMTRPEVI